ncbi:hypothetical protein BH23CHL10_BH23CHL10_17110 [soil metagenome]
MGDDDALLSVGRLGWSGITLAAGGERAGEQDGDDGSLGGMHRSKSGSIGAITLSATL